MRVLGLLVLMPTVAFGAGFYIGENGTKTLMMGGAFAGEADDLSAIQHNPAGLAQLSGFHFLLDGNLVFHSITYQREDPNFDPSAPPTTPVQPVSNTGGPFVAPFFSVGYGFNVFDRNLMIALGIYGPPADGHYAYPAPDYTRNTAGQYEMDPRKYAPQRYALVDNNILIIFPTLSIAYAIHPRFMLGVSIQPVLATLSFSQSITSNITTPTRMSQEDPSFDSVVNVNMPWQYAGFTGIIGALYKPIDMVSIGASFRPPVPITAHGNLGIELGEIAKGLGTTVNGDQATLKLTLPMELKVGVHVTPTTRLAVNFDFVYQGWQSVQEIVLTPNNVTLSMNGGAATPVAQINIIKNWVHSHQFRLGASYQLLSFLALYLGGWYESGAIPNATIGVDFLHFEAFYLTGGVGFKVGPIEILLGAAGSPTQTHAVTTSTAIAANTNAPIVNGDSIGSGIYTTGYFMATAGIRGHFGGSGAKATAPPVEPAPVPAIEEPAPTPAATPAPTTTTPAPAENATP